LHRFFVNSEGIHKVAHLFQQLANREFEFVAAAFRRAAFSSYGWAKPAGLKAAATKGPRNSACQALHRIAASVHLECGRIEGKGESDTRTMARQSWLVVVSYFA
jgi:hypothetical protein